MFSQAGTKPLHVVVVDDERPILDELRLFGWQECGAELSGVFTNGAEALDFCIDNEVDLPRELQICPGRTAFRSP